MFVRQALQLGRLVHAIIMSLLHDDSAAKRRSVQALHCASLLSSDGIFSKLRHDRRPAPFEIAVLAEPNEHEDEDLLGGNKILHRAASMRHEILSKKASLSQELMRQKEKHVLKHQKRVLFALRTMLLLRRPNKGSLRHMFSMTAVRFRNRCGP